MASGIKSRSFDSVEEADIIRIARENAGIQPAPVGGDNVPDVVTRVTPLIGNQRARIARTQGRKDSLEESRTDKRSFILALGAFTGVRSRALAIAGLGPALPVVALATKLISDRTALQEARRQERGAFAIPVRVRLKDIFTPDVRFDDIITGAGQALNRGGSFLRALGVQTEGLANLIYARSLGGAKGIYDRVSNDVFQTYWQNLQQPHARVQNNQAIMRTRWERQLQEGTFYGAWKENGPIGN